MQTERILLIEDDAAVQDTLSAILTEEGYEVQIARDGIEGIALAKESVFHLFMIDVRLPKMNGIDVLKEIRRINSQATCIILTAYGTVEQSVKAMKAGAYDFILKPFQIDQVQATVRNAIDYQRLVQENHALKKTVHERYRFGNMIGQSQKLMEVCSLIEKVSDSDSTVLIQGESGTGKEVVAKTIHFNSNRKHKPFIPVNCGAIPEALLESELFGHERGAFTGATSSRIGRFEMAHGGTLFLDEISEMSLSLQVKLLRILQEREFERVGGNRSIHVDVRIISATNQDLDQAVSEKCFRKDLFYRLNVIPIHLPPLRDRADDIPLLINHFLARFNSDKGGRVCGISPEAMEFLLNYSWPGNIRELENLIERVVTLKGEGLVESGDLPMKLTQSNGHSLLPEILLPEDGINFSELVSQFEKMLLHQALHRANGVKNRAAQLLHLNRTTLVEKLKKQRMMAGSSPSRGPIFDS